ncbi:GMC oxidoreductase [Parathielavia appendiculata]|uniref:GMC oxidoreductase n=1 Tax=Parathielavia appendiculata TaxID=2587402 RepID=A0AAN6U791_9PEZI|nr:GMC oxidoreductase [Parathielavia appendiculata]
MGKKDQYDCEVLCDFGSGPVGYTVLMVEAGADESNNLGEHSKNAACFQKDIDSFGSLQPTSVPTDESVVPTLPPVYPTSERLPILDDNKWDMLYDDAEKLIGPYTDLLQGSIRQRKRGNKNERQPAAFPLFLAAKLRNLNSEYITWSSSYRVLEPILAEAKYRGRIKVEEVVESVTIRQSSDDKEDEVRARMYIVCGGSILTPQLLFNSGFRTEETNTQIRTYTETGLSYVRSQLAIFRTLIETETLPFLRLPTLISPTNNVLCEVVLDRRWIKAVYGPNSPDKGGSNPYPGWDEKNQRRSDLREKKWNDKIIEHLKTQEGREPQDKLPFPFNDLDPQATLPVTDKRPWHTEIHRDAFSYGAVPPSIDKRTIIDLRFFGPVEPTYGNRVTFTKKIKDSYGMPQPTFHNTRTETDRDLTHRMLKHMEELSGVLGGSLSGSEPQSMENGLALHISGTTRAGSSKRDSCCNRFSQIHGVDNLFVGGLNVIPGKNASNPILTDMRFAIKAAGRISDRLWDDRDDDDDDEEEEGEEERRRR